MDLSILIITIGHFLLIYFDVFVIIYYISYIFVKFYGHKRNIYDAVINTKISNDGRQTNVIQIIKSYALRLIKILHT